jgi:zinc transporter, ZIP family
MLGYVGYLLIPVVTLLLGGLIACYQHPSDRMYGLVQHFTAGIIFSAVAVELLPALEKTNVMSMMVSGFVLGVVLMLWLKEMFSHMSIVVPTAVDLFIDGFLVALGFYIGVQGGVVLLVGLTFETFTLGLAMIAVFRRRSMLFHHQWMILVLFAVSIIGGYLLGYSMYSFMGNQHFLSFILSFGVAALLYLVTEELLVEAHSVEDTPFITAMFFVGFLIPLILAHSPEILG